MAEFDKLEISIEANASGAQSAIDGLSRSLGNLDKALNLKNAGGLLSTLKDLGNIPNLSNLGNAFKNIDLTQINAATKELASNLRSASEAAQKLADTLKNIKTGDVSALKEKFDSINNANTATNNSNPFKGWGEEAKAAGDNIQNAEEAARKTTEEFRSSIEALTEAIKKMGEKSKNITVKTPKTQTLKKETPKVTTSEGQLKTLGSALAISKELNDFVGKIGEKLSRVGDMGFKLSKMMLTPLKAVVNEYKEKLDKIGGYFENFRQKAQESLKKLSAFWKRVMKTFTFMLVRKAITAIIGEIKEATESLALFSQEMGTSFNENMSNAIADLKWIGKAIVGAFEPIINYVVPVLNVLSAALVKVITLLGHFFAALTGQGYYMVAKKKVDDYADSLKKAKKQTQLSIRGFDELNNLTTPKSSDSDKAKNPADDWEMKPVSDKMKKFADMIKDLAKKLWEPIAKAWDRTKEYVISGFKYMVGELGKLAKSIGRDFLKAWQEEQTVHIFENIFNMVGDIERVVGNLAKNFRKAWDTVVDGETRGYWIFHGILKIVDTLTTHLRNVTQYMVEWSDSITFDALLDSFIQLLGALDKVADFIGGVFEDVMKNVVLKYVKWLIEEGTPHLFETISMIIDKIDWDKLRSDLVPVEEAFEHLLESIHTGVTNAIGAVGSAFAEWVNSDKFTKFMESLAKIMNQITAERVEKVLEGLGLAVLHIAQAVADFVSGDKFQGFIEKIGKWIDNHSAEDIARIAEGIIKVAAACKVAGAAISKASGLIKVLTQFNTIRIGANIAKELSKINAATKGAEKFKMFKMPGFNKAGGVEILGDGAAESTVKGFISKLTSGFASVNWSSVFFGDIGANMAAGGATAAATFATAFIGGITAAIGGYNFGKFLGDKLFDPEKTGIYKDFKLFDFKNLFSGDVLADLQASFDAVVNMFTDFENNPSIAAMTTFLGSLSMPLVTLGIHLGKLVHDGNFDAIGQKFTELKESASEKFGQIKEDVTGAFSLIGQDISNFFAPAISVFEGFKTRVEAVFQGIGIIIKAVFITIVGWINTNVVVPVSQFFVKLWSNIKGVWNSAVSWFNTAVIQPLVTIFNTCVTTIQAAFNTVWSAIQMVFSTVVSVINTTVIQPVIAAFNFCVTTIQTAFTNAWNVIKGVWSVAYNWFYAYIIQPIKNAFTIALNSIKAAFNVAWNVIKQGAKTAINGVISGIERAINGVIKGINALIGGFNKVVGAAAKVTGDSWGGVPLLATISLPRFATGGFPEDGLFMANHGELVGEFSNGQTAVANNEQIIEGIKAGVMDAMMQVLPSFAQAVGGETNITIEGDMGKLFKAMVKENGSMNKRTFGGSPLYA